MDSLSSNGNALSSTLQSMSEQEKRELQQMLMNEEQKSKVQKSIHALTDMCFKKCVGTKINDSKLDRYEEPCMANCVDRFMDANSLIVKQLESLRTKGAM